MTRTIYELTEEEINELKFFMLYDDVDEFYETIDEISTESVIARFGRMAFRTEDFSCNMAVAV